MDHQISFWNFLNFQFLCVYLKGAQSFFTKYQPSETEVRWLIKKNAWYTWSTCRERDYSQIMDYNGVFYSLENSKASWTDHYNVHGAMLNFAKSLIYAPHATGPCKMFLVREVMMAATPFIFVTRLFLKLHHAWEWDVDIIIILLSSSWMNEYYCRNSFLV